MVLCQQYLDPIECLTNSVLSSVQVFIANILMIAFVILEKMAAFAVIICTSTLVGLVSSCLHSNIWTTLFPDHLTHHKYFCLNQEKAGSLVIEPAVRVSKLELRLMDQGGGTSFLHSTVLESLGCILLNRTESKVIFLFYKSMLNLAPLASLLLHLNHHIWACSTTNITKLCISLHLYCFAWK